MKNLLLFFLSLPLAAFAQIGPPCTPEVVLSYDAAGNRIQRKEICDENPPQNRLENPQAALLVYPNPHDGRFSVRITNDIDVQIWLYDRQGRLILSAGLPPEGLKIDLSAHPAGVYYLRVKGRDFEAAQAVVKQ
ncbi:MAG: T9SS type A sorting domain-containing protein [Bacteroidia bacterium]